MNQHRVGEVKSVGAEGERGRSLRPGTDDSSDADATLRRTLNEKWECFFQKNEGWSRGDIFIFVDSNKTVQNGPLFARPDQDANSMKGFRSIANNTCGFKPTFRFEKKFLPDWGI